MLNRRLTALPRCAAIPVTTVVRAVAIRYGIAMLPYALATTVVVGAVLSLVALRYGAAGALSRHLPMALCIDQFARS